MNAVAPKNTVADFKPNQRVRYCPAHAWGDTQHPDCETGIVTSVDDTHVWVCYGGNKAISQPTDPVDLIRLR